MSTEQSLTGIDKVRRWRGKQLRALLLHLGRWAKKVWSEHRCSALKNRFGLQLWRHNSACKACSTINEKATTLHWSRSIKLKNTCTVITINKQATLAPSHSTCQKYLSISYKQSKFHEYWYPETTGSAGVKNWIDNKWVIMALFL